MPFMLRLGPIRYDSRRGVFTWKTRALRIDSRNRKQRSAAKAKKTRARKDRQARRDQTREARRQQWRDLHATPPANKTPARTTATTRKPRAAAPAPRTPTRTAPAARATATRTTPTALPMPDRMARVRGAGMCGHPTQDGSPCLRRGTCPPGIHTRR